MLTYVAWQKALAPKLDLFVSHLLGLHITKCPDGFYSTIRCRSIFYSPCPGGGLVFKETDLLTQSDIVHVLLHYYMSQQPTISLCYCGSENANVEQKWKKNLHCTVGSAHTPGKLLENMLL